MAWRRVSIWTNGGSVCWLMYAPPDVDKLNLII